jgi:hypothetical protein
MIANCHAWGQLNPYADLSASTSPVEPVEPLSCRAREAEQGVCLTIISPSRGFLVSTHVDRTCKIHELIATIRAGLEDWLTVAAGFTSAGRFRSSRFIK